MHEPIDEHRRHDFISEDIAPFREALVRGEPVLARSHRFAVSEHPALR
jgi:hypothetical protein